MKEAKSLKKKKKKEYQQFKYKKQEISYKRGINQCQKYYRRLDNYKLQVYQFAAEQGFKGL